MTERREVLVLGGGPAGSTAAALLAAEGRDVLLLDKARFPRLKACSEYASPASLEVLDALGARAAYEAAGPSRLLGMEIVPPSGRGFRVEYDEGGERAYALALSRARLDPLLLENARARGAEVREGVRAQKLLLDGDSVRGVVARGPDGADLPIEARLVVGADGLHSVVSRDLGVRSEAWWPRRLGLVGHYEGAEGLDAWGEMHVQPWGYCGIAPLEDGTASVGMALDMRRYRGSARGGRAIFAEALGMFPSIREKLERARLARPVSGVGPIARRVRRTQGDGWALAGDAAGFTDPFTGEGIYRALRGGQLLAETAVPALLRGGPTAAALAPYAGARSRAFRHKSMVVLMVQAFVSYPALLEYAAPRMLERPALRATVSSVLGDLSDARRVLHPRFLLDVLAP